MLELSPRTAGWGAVKMVNPPVKCFLSKLLVLFANSCSHGVKLQETNVKMQVIFFFEQRNKI